MRFPASQLLCLAAALATSACASETGDPAIDPVDAGPPDWNVPTFDTPPRDDAPLQTDRLDYILHPTLTAWEPGETVALVTYRNTSAETVFFSRCTPEHDGPIYELLRAAPDGGYTIAGPAWACGGGVPRGEIQPGEERVFTARLGSSLVPSGDSDRMRDRVGLFRIYFDFYPSADAEVGAGRLPFAERRTNVFQIHPPD